MCKIAYRTAFGGQSIGTEQEIVDLTWKIATGSEIMATVFYENEGILSITSDMYLDKMEVEVEDDKGKKTKETWYPATIELITTPVEMSCEKGIKGRKIAIEAITRILHQCIQEPKILFPEISTIPAWNNMKLKKLRIKPDCEEWEIELEISESLKIPELYKFKMYVFKKAGVVSKIVNYIPGSVSFGNQVSISVPISKLESFLDSRQDARWWNENKENIKCPEEIKNSRIANADTAYKYFMSIFLYEKKLYLKNENLYCLPTDDTYLMEANAKNTWSVVPRCSPVETMKALVGKAFLAELVNCLDKEIETMKDRELKEGEGKDKKAKDEAVKKGKASGLIKEQMLLMQRGLAHTTVSGVTINEEPALVFELRGSGTEYRKYLCDIVRIG